MIRIMLSIVAMLIVGGLQASGNKSERGVEKVDLKKSNISKQEPSWKQKMRTKVSIAVKKGCLAPGEEMLIRKNIEAATAPFEWDIRCE